MDRITTVETWKKGTDTTFDGCQAGSSYINFEPNGDVKRFPDLNEPESTSGILLKHADICTRDILLRMSMVCSNHHCDELLTILYESVNYLPGVFSRYKSMEEIGIYFELHFCENVKEDGLKLNLFTYLFKLFVDPYAKDPIDVLQ